MRSKCGVDAETKESHEWRNLQIDQNNVRDGKNKKLNSLSGMERNKMFLNSEGTKFQDLSPLSGTDSVADGRSFAIWDYDHDGWQDIALINTNDPHFQIFHNNHPKTPQAKHGFVAIRFVGGNRTSQPDDRWACRDGYGAVAAVRVGKLNMVRELRCGEGFAAQNSSTLIIGIGDNQNADAVSVRWPSGKEQVANEIRSGSLITFFENPADAPDGSGYWIESYIPATGSGIDNPVVADRGLFLFDVPELQSDNAELRVFFTMATWCTACRQHSDFIAELMDRFAGERVAFYGVPIDLADDTEKLVQYEQQQKAPYTILSNLSAQQRTMVADHLKNQLNSDAMPGTIVTDSAGNSIEELLGIPTVSDLFSMLDAR